MNRKRNRLNCIFFVTLTWLLLIPFASGTSPASEDFDMITKRGRLLAEYLTSVDVAMKDLRNGSKVVTDFRCIAMKNETGWVVDVGKASADGSTFLVAYEATLLSNSHDSVVKAYAPPLEDKGLMHFASKAIETVSNQLVADHEVPPEMAVLPTQSGNYFVYVLTARTTPDRFFFGKDVRYLVSSDGSRVLETRWVHKGILEFKEGTAGHRPVGGVHTHILTDAVEDSDVAYVLLRKPPLPEFIRTKNHTFIVETDGSIQTK